MIMRRTCGLVVLIAAAISFSMPARQAGAALGDSAGSIASDRKALRAVQRATTVRSGYTVQEIGSDATTVREYVSPAGVVFAVSWNGRVHPDLNALLGSYAGEYQSALKQTPRKRGLRRQKVESSQVIVEKWGHMRNLQGRAYAPALVPSGVVIDEIR
ncbi:hypothetical protein OR1_01569 [Geobacter sp. OR-1]|uniref:DUF2844 domain-containing protein n=1 Tax=Geobacter sp. OR-1 TaxID=1266765 RepID=UPI000542BB95|nr:DUF2844 domain-containing protein [Geobacter sp. OR-1]GAM09294.1 hypothetical protein OR1_01569 [Geobacter sp. OR-1]